MNSKSSSDFFLSLDPPQWNWKLNHKDPVFLLGSCFSDSIGDRFVKYKFQTLINPYGTLYHPLALAQCLKDLLNNQSYQYDDLTQKDDQWFSWNHHGQFNSTDPDLVLKDIQRNVEEGHAFLKKAQLLVITFGTAWTYRLNSTGNRVANCHKVPASEFTKELLTPEEIEKEWTPLLKDLQAFNPGLKIIFTVSPIRHIRDGIIENNRSKAALIQATHQLVDQNPNREYFPAYEWIIDVLRDYRFFQTDRVHPSEEAVQFIWEQLTQSLFNQETQAWNQIIDQILQGLNHRTNNPDSRAHQLFLEKLKQKMVAFQHSSGLSFEKELKRLKHQKA
ncbi:GSCFA domain-containing protein [bacterium SCSIO 12741]|nr:GSCFA domain-containing protein [bacterium SCSIO 12741]